MPDKVAIIIGAGPAGLTAAYELLKTTEIKPIVVEMSAAFGGISRTINHNGNRMDIGGHRFFSKSDAIMDWWLGIMPLQASPARDGIPASLHTHDGQRPSPDPEVTDVVMLLRRRLSRIFYLRHFFDYPVSLNFSTLNNLGLSRVVRIGVSYLRRVLFPIKKERSLEDFFINRFGDELYRLFFRDYTEKVWGVKPSAINPDWGAQRVKGLSILKVITHALSHMPWSKEKDGVDQKNVETSLIGRFYYPKLGPGQLWEHVADRVREMGGEIRLQQRVSGVTIDGGRIVGLTLEDTTTGESQTLAGDYVFSSMPIRELVTAMGKTPPQHVREVANGLVYRDFITVGLLLRQKKAAGAGRADLRKKGIPDLWVYIQERDVKVGRLQLFHNWSPYLVSDPDNIWVGLEYFYSEGDELDALSEDAMAELAVHELEKLGLADPKDVIDHVVAKVPKAYPAYFGSYGSFDDVRTYLDSIGNLYCIGRNGQHRYNNMDHSMLTAMAAVEIVRDGTMDKSAIWAVNTEKDYHEEK